MYTCTPPAFIEVFEKLRAIYFLKSSVLSFYVSDRIQHCLLVVGEIFAFSTSSHFSHQEALHIDRMNTVREIDLLASFSWLLMSGEPHGCNNKEILLSGAILLFLSLHAEVADLG